MQGEDVYGKEQLPVFSERMSEDFSLSLQVRVLWAKTGGGEERNRWSALYVHMGDSVFVARKLWDEWLSDSVKRLISDCVNGDNNAAVAFVSWLAGVHDIGKATPGFQYKVLERAEHVEEAGLRVPAAHMMNHPPSHANMGEVILENWLGERGWDYPWTFGSIVGSHHGACSSTRALEDIKNETEDLPVKNLGDQSWHSAQCELLDWLFEMTGMAECEHLFQSLSLPQQVQVLISALAIMADWISSNSDYFPLDSCIESYDELQLRANKGWSSLALPSAWHAKKVDLGDQEFFHCRFSGLPESARLRPAQMEALRVAIDADAPCLLIIEAPMGNGKTEASLLCAEVLAAKNGAGGIAYLLPTMATSNAMFNRVEKWLQNVPDARGVSMQSMRLLHGKAALNQDYSELCRWGNTWMGDKEKSCTEENAIAHQWFGGNKRGLLSSFVVGTVDQLLMAALKTKHVQLRHLGLAGKVVVIDEVHAYDAYMNTYLDRILTWLGAYEVPTILLSATLPESRRSELVRAYRGRDTKSAGRRSRRADIPDPPQDEFEHPLYPLVTMATREEDLDETMYRACKGSTAGTDVIVQKIDETDETLVALLDDLLSDGGCACVLRDTVNRAQNTYEQLRRVFGDSCVKLVRSRFIAVDRMANDTELLQLLGPDSEKRPSKLVVVGTQVIEQSLDIDFDVMLTDIAPVDLLLQRMGRLHRHQRGEDQSLRPEKLRQARCYITGVERWGMTPPEIAKGIESVYPRALLWRSLLAIWSQSGENKTATINIPNDIAELIKRVYSNNTSNKELLPAWCKQEWEYALHAADEELQQSRNDAQLRASAWLLSKVQKRQTASLIDWMNDSCLAMDEVRGRAAVRDSDESIEVVIVQEKDSGFELLPWIVDEQGNRPSGGVLGNGCSAPDDEVARLAANCTVCLPPSLSAKWSYESVIGALESQCSLPGWQESRWLQGQLILALDSSLSAAIETEFYAYRLRYSRKTGLELIASNRKGENAK